MIVRMDKENGTAKADERPGKSIIVVKDAREVSNLLGARSGLGRSGVVRLCLVKTARRPECKIIAGLQRAARETTLRRSAISRQPVDEEEECSDELTVDEDESSDEDCPPNPVQTVDVTTETEVGLDDYSSDSAGVYEEITPNGSHEVTIDGNGHIFNEVVLDNNPEVPVLTQVEKGVSPNFSSSRESSRSAVIDHHYSADDIDDDQEKEPHEEDNIDQEYEEEEIDQKEVEEILLDDDEISRTVEELYENSLDTNERLQLRNVVNENSRNSCAQSEQDEVPETGSLNEGGSTAYEEEEQSVYVEEHCDESGAEEECIDVEESYEGEEADWNEDDRLEGGSDAVIEHETEKDSNHLSSPIPVDEGESEYEEIIDAEESQMNPPGEPVDLDGNESEYEEEEEVEPETVDIEENQDLDSRVADHSVDVEGNESEYEEIEEVEHETVQVEDSEDLESEVPVDVADAVDYDGEYEEFEEDEQQTVNVEESQESASQDIQEEKIEQGLVSDEEVPALNVEDDNAQDVVLASRNENDCIIVGSEEEREEEYEDILIPEHVEEFLEEEDDYTNEDESVNRRENEDDDTIIEDERANKWEEDDSKSRPDSWNNEMELKGEEWNEDSPRNLEEDVGKISSQGDEETPMEDDDDEMYMEYVDDEFDGHDGQTEKKDSSKTDAESSDQTVPEFNQKSREPEEEEYVVVDDSEDELTFQEPEVSCVVGGGEVEVDSSVAVEEDGDLTIIPLQHRVPSYRARFGDRRRSSASPPVFERLALCDVKVFKHGDSAPGSPNPPEPSLVIEPVASTGPSYSERAAAPVQSCSCPSCVSAPPPAPAAALPMYDPLLIDWRNNDPLRFALPSALVDLHDNFIHFLLTEMEAMEVCESSRRKVKSITKRQDGPQRLALPAPPSVVPSGLPPSPYSSSASSSYGSYPPSVPYQQNYTASPSSYVPFYPHSQHATAPYSYPSYPQGYPSHPPSGYSSGGYAVPSYPYPPSMSAGYPSANYPSNYPSSSYSSYNCPPPKPTSQLTITPLTENSKPHSPKDHTQTHISITPLPPKQPAISPMPPPMINKPYHNVMNMSQPVVPPKAMISPGQSMVPPPAMVASVQNMMASQQPMMSMSSAQAMLSFAQSLMSSTSRMTPSMIATAQAFMSSGAQSMMPPPPPPVFQPRVPRKRGRPPLEPNYDRVSPRTRTWWSGGSMILPGQSMAGISPRLPGAPHPPTMYSPSAYPRGAASSRGVYHRRQRPEENVATVPVCDPSTPVGGRSMSDAGPEKALAELSKMVTPKDSKKPDIATIDLTKSERYALIAPKRPAEMVGKPSQEPPSKKIALNDAITFTLINGPSLKKATPSTEPSVNIEEKKAEIIIENITKKVAITPIVESAPKDQKEVTPAEPEVKVVPETKKIVPVTVTVRSKDVEEVQRLLNEARARKAARAKQELRVSGGSHLPVMAMPRPGRSAQPLRPPPRKPSPPPSPAVAAPVVAPVTTAATTKRIKVMLPRRDGGVLTLNVEPLPLPPKSPSPPPTPVQAKSPAQAKSPIPPDPPVVAKAATSAKPSVTKAQVSTKSPAPTKTPVSTKSVTSAKSSAKPSPKQVVTRQPPRVPSPPLPSRQLDDEEVTRSGRKRKVIHGNPKFRDMEMLDPRELRLGKSKAPSAREAAQARQVREMARLKAAKQKEKVQEAKYKQFLAVNDIYLKPQTFV